MTDGCALRPLALALALALALTGCSNTQGIDLRNRINEALDSGRQVDNTSTIDVAQLDDRAWTRLVVACGGSSGELEALLGFPWEPSRAVDYSPFFGMLILADDSTVIDWYNVGANGFDDDQYFTPCPAGPYSAEPNGTPLWAVTRADSTLSFRFGGGLWFIAPEGIPTSAILPG